MTSDGDESRRDRLIQEHLEGAFGADELRRRLRASGEREDERLEEELAAYRAVWEGLAEETEARLTPGFAARVARSAAAERQEPNRDRLMEALLVLAFVVPAAAAVTGLGFLLPSAGFDAGALLRAAADALMRVPAAVRGVVGSGAVLLALDRAWTRRRPFLSGTPR